MFFNSSVAMKIWFYFEIEERFKGSFKTASPVFGFFDSLVKRRIQKGGKNLSLEDCSNELIND